MCPVSVTTALASCPALRTTGKGKNFRPQYRRSDPRKSRPRFFLLLAAVWSASIHTSSNPVHVRYRIHFLRSLRPSDGSLEDMAVWRSEKHYPISPHPSAFSFRRRRRGHSIPRSVHCRRHHATRWRPPRPRKKKVSLTPLLFALWLEEPPLGNEALFIFQTERSLLHEKWESRGKRGNLDPNQVEARKCTPV